MFCPKCGVENPDNGKFCRSCRTNIGNVLNVLSAKSTEIPYVVDPRKRGVSWEFAYTKIFTGLAFLIISLILAFTGKLGAQNWWFWLLIPAFGSLSSGVAQFFQLRKIEKLEAGFSPQNSQLPSSNSQNILTSGQNDYITAPRKTIYDTDDLVVQPSVTDNTTRQLEINKEGETITLPKL